MLIKQPVFSLRAEYIKYANHRGGGVFVKVMNKVTSDMYLHFRSYFVRKYATYVKQ